jgi:hypothetical protein
MKRQTREKSKRLMGREINSTRILILLLWISALRSSGQGLSAGPFVHEFPLTLSPGYRVEAFGPLLSWEQSETHRQWALSPLISSSADPAVDSRELDIAYPVFTLDRFGSEYRLQLMQLFSFSGGKDQRETNVHRFTLFPIYFQQRSPDTSRNYTALFPFYGHLQNRLFRDRVDFVGWPIYVKTERRGPAYTLVDELTSDGAKRPSPDRLGLITTYNYFLPFFHLRYGDGLRGWQVWPFAGYERQQVLSKTNMWGETEVVGGYDKLTVLWPFFFNQHLDLGTTNPVSRQVFLPFYSLERSPSRDSTSYLWPLGFTATEDRGRRYREWDAPWPLVVFARGEGKTANRVWPFFGLAEGPNLESDFYFWPIYKYDRFHTESIERERTRLLFFLYSDITEQAVAAPAAPLATNTLGVADAPVAGVAATPVAPVMRRRTDLWPLFTAKADANGQERFQMLAPLEPLLPNNKSVERNYSPVWSFWRTERNAKTGASSESLLWNLYRYEASTNAKKGSLFFGLFQYQSGPHGKQVRLFYIPLGKTNAPTASSRKK